MKRKVALRLTAPGLSTRSKAQRAPERDPLRKVLPPRLLFELPAQSLRLAVNARPLRSNLDLDRCARKRRKHQ